MKRTLLICLLVLFCFLPAGCATIGQGGALLFNGFVKVLELPFKLINGLLHIYDVLPHPPPVLGAQTPLRISV